MKQQVFLIKTIVWVLTIGAAGVLKGQTLTITQQATGSSASLRGLCAISEQVAWASGSGGTVLRTENGGNNWLNVSVPNADSLQFRDIEAFNEKEAVVLSAGTPAKIYKTNNGGLHWKEVYSNTHPQIFFDAMGFWDRSNGIAFSDAIDGHLVIITTQDGGETWEEINYANLPPSPEGEGGFAASGTCLTTFGASTVWIGLGSPASRIFKSIDKGKTWSVTETPMKRPELTGGIFSLAFSSRNYGIAVGGDYEDATNKTLNSAITTNGGSTWQLLTAKQPNGYRSAVTNIPNTKWWISTGPSGVDLSKDNGISWEVISSDGYHAVSFGSSKIGWLSGANGKAARIIIE